MTLAKGTRNSLRGALLFWLLIPAVDAHAHFELALIPKVGYFEPIDKKQELNTVDFEFDRGPASGVAFEFRALFGEDDTKCGIGFAPEYFEYTYKSKYTFGGQQRSGEAQRPTLGALFKAICATERAAFSLGAGGSAFSRSYVDIGDREIETDGGIAYAASAEFGGSRARVYTELRYAYDPRYGARQYDGSGVGVLVGVSFVLVNKSTPWWTPAYAETSEPAEASIATPWWKTFVPQWQHPVPFWVQKQAGDSE